MRTLINEMISNGLTVSDRDFSKRWLGRAPNYMSDRKDDTLTTDAALQLYVRLSRAGQRELANRVWTEIILPRIPA